MTTLREAAQQALEYLDAPSAKLWPAGTQHRIITALRAALAEPVQEPVASIYVTLDGDREFDDWRHDLPVGRNLLYAAPPQRKPLTEEEIIDAVRDADLDWTKGRTLDETQSNRFATLARAIERAHGIGEKDE